MAGWKWVPLIPPHHAAMEARPTSFWGLHVPLVAGFAAVLHVPVVQAWSGVAPWPAAIALGLQVLVFGLVVHLHLMRTWPAAASTVLALLNFSVCAALAGLSGHAGTVLWGLFLAYALMSALVCGRSRLVVLLILALPLGVGLAWHLTGVIGLGDSLGALVGVQALTLAPYMLLAHATDEGEDARARLQVAEEAAAVARERERIARDLHDSLGASLCEAAQWLELGRASPAAAAAEPMRLASRRIDQAIADLRACVSAFGGATVPAEALEATLRAGLAGLCAASGVALDLVVSGAPAPFSPVQAHHLTLMATEAAANAIRHGAARALRVEVAVGDGVRLRVEDDGTGFDPEHARHGVGLTSIQERARALGCRASIDSAIGRGTRLVVAPAGGKDGAP